MKKLKPFGRKTLGETILHILVSFVFAVVAFTYVYLFFWAVMSATKTHTEIVLNPFALPEQWHWAGRLR
jgi:ABC-type glycerol-3-phosphate transport system permease component